MGSFANRRSAGDRKRGVENLAIAHADLCLTLLVLVKVSGETNEKINCFTIFATWPMKSLRLSLTISVLVGLVSVSYADESPAPASSEAKQIAVEDVVSDKKIQKRLSDILTAVGSYEEVKVKVQFGVVILSGLVDEEEQIEWAHDLATRMDGVVAVQSQIKTRPKKILDLTPARKEIQGFNVTFMRHLPTIVLAVSVLGLSFFLFFLASLGFRRALSQKILSPLLLNATSRMLSVPVLLLGLYLALKISGLTGLAFTVLGGTGLLGLAVGLGLKNSFEDYAASIFLSIKKPFRPGDWVKIGDFEGIVQKVTSRSTLIIDFSGNHVLMPNSLVYKSIITNRTANPKMRSTFVLGIDYDDSTEAAQVAILDILSKHEFVLKDPEPWVLVDELAASAVNLRTYFWLNVREVSVYKVTSQLLLEVKNVLLEQGFRFPDPDRETILIHKKSLDSEPISPKESKTPVVASRPPGVDEVRAEASELNRQSQESDLPDQGENVL